MFAVTNKKEDKNSEKRASEMKYLPGYFSSKHINIPGCQSVNKIG
jgi:hypothetical protein